MKPSPHGWIYLGVVALAICALSGYLYYGHQEYSKLNTEHTVLKETLEKAQATILEKDASILAHTNDLESLKQAYALSEENGAELLGQLTSERDRNDAFEDEIGKISGTVGDLDKLAKTDPELLMKYSKVYFLNEHYVPEKVGEIPSDFRFKKDEPEYIHGKVLSKLKRLLQKAQDDGIDLLVVSGYRSYDEQRGLKSTYTTIYGTGANAFSADQGYSEHQLGTTVDFTTTAIGGSLNGFDTTTSYAWLQKNAHKYGFVLSYPKNNSFYTFEPWHWRFVGEDLAGDLHRDGKFFYDLEQRDIDEYLIKLFD